jgi:peptide/nickel transport system ATP-binding protein
MPSAAEEIRGCVFASRCPRKIGAICDEVVPPVRQFGKHTIVCHLDLRCVDDAHTSRRIKEDPVPGFSL